MNNELTHHGILGMKWGVRRFQNKDGTLTAKGKVQKKSNRSSKQQLLKKKSTEQLRKDVNRLQLEKQYLQLTGNDISRGRQYVNKTVKAGMTVAAITSTALTLHGNAGKISVIVNKLLKKHRV